MSTRRSFVKGVIGSIAAAVLVRLGGRGASAASCPRAVAYQCARAYWFNYSLAVGCYQAGVRCCYRSGPAYVRCIRRWYRFW